MMTDKKKLPKDINKLAKALVDLATDETQDNSEPESQPQKNQAAVELGRLGGMKGGKARAEKMTPEQRSEIAKKAAKARCGPVEVATKRRLELFSLKIS